MSDDYFLVSWNVFAACKMPYCRFLRPQFQSSSLLPLGGNPCSLQCKDTRLRVIQMCWLVLSTQVRIIWEMDLWEYLRGLPRLHMSVWEDSQVRCGQEQPSKGIKSGEAAWPHLWLGMWLPSLLHGDGLTVPWTASLNKPILPELFLSWYFITVTGKVNKTTESQKCF